MNKFDKFQENYDAAIKTIHSFLEGPESMKELVKWMMETDANPYSYLPESWAGSVDSAEGFAGLLYYIHHAVEDDGDICFVKVRGEPRIVFANPYDKVFRDKVLTKQEKVIEKRPVFGEIREIEIEVLDITPNEFGKIYNEYQVKDLKRCFSIDAARNGVEFAKQHYSDYNCWNDSWEEDCQEEIEKWKNFYGKIVQDLV